MGGHCFGKALPARERVTLLDRCSLGRDGRAIGNGHLFIEGTVDVVDELVGVDRVAAQDFDVVSRHCRGNVLPAGERMALFDRCLGSDNGLTVDDGPGLDHLSADFEDSLVGVDGERARDSHVVGRHRLGETLPAREGITLFDRGGLGRDGRAERHINSFVGLPVDTIRELIGVDLEDSRQIDVAVHDDGARIVGIAVRPLREVIALGRSGTERQLGTLGAASALEIDRAAGAGAEVHVEISLNFDNEWVGGIAYAAVGFKLK